MVEVQNEMELLKESTLGDLKIRNRIMMAAMTRQRGDPNEGLPLDIHHKYFGDRAEDAGVILTDCMAVTLQGEGFPGNLKCYSDKHKEGLKKLVETVHKNGSVFYAQLFHCGRSTNSKVIGEQPVSSSSILNRSQTKFETPKELSTEEIAGIQAHFKNAFNICKEAGFDGVELHGANGYLIDQFLRDHVNQRKDNYGGSVENRCRFALELIDSAIEVFGAKQVGIKLSPLGRFNDMKDTDPKNTYTYLLQELNKRKICFVELMRHGDMGPNHYNDNPDEQWPELSSFTGIKDLLPDVLLVGNFNLSAKEAEELIKAKKIDLASFGRPYLANPDFAQRIKNNWELAQPNWSLLFGENLANVEDGFSTYPKYESK